MNITLNPIHILIIETTSRLPKWHPNATNHLHPKIITPSMIPTNFIRSQIEDQISINIISSNKGINS